MSKLKALASQTMIYGVSTILGRLLMFALTPVYTYVFKSTEEVGVITATYGYVALLNVLCSMAMETTFFFYANKENEQKAFSSGFTVILTAAGITSLLILFFAPVIDGIQQTGNPWYYRMIAGTLLFDALAILPFARMRLKNQARRFAIIRFSAILVTVALNAVFLFGCTELGDDPTFGRFFDASDKVFYVFLANFMASAFALIMVLNQFKGVRPSFDGKVLNDMLKFAWPLVVVGIAGWINENMDKSIMDRLLPGTLEEGRQGVGIYGAVYKLSIVMAIIVQAFKFAAEPFFFGIQKDKDARETYALVLKWFVIVQCLVFLGVALNLDILLFIVEENFREGKAVVPIVLLGQLFLGVYYNLSIWYKLTERTIWGLYMSLAGAGVTIALLFTLVPSVGYIGAAWATFFSFLVMMILSFVAGKKYYPVPYDYGRIALYIGLAIVLWLIYHGAGLVGYPQQVITAAALILIYSAFVWAVEKPRKLLLLRK